jgi:hypothetical protein
VKDRLVLHVPGRTKDVFLKESERSLSLEIGNLLQGKSISLRKHN